ncbi:hypothetical protein BDN71DRAFT_816873 [Pleurotus eryngii]|uniref:Uncharacterized protein n=1 Tax=Pleurotus eryngii TaxID=5323 RepID=A0A9P6A057_PLEER|nr:hypothetical protein BDN71DRAFT_816873 [Pleurotus eryngii]
MSPSKVGVKNNSAPGRGTRWLRRHRRGGRRVKTIDNRHYSFLTLQTDFWRRRHATTTEYTRSRKGTRSNGSGHASASSQGAAASKTKHLAYHLLVVHQAMSRLWREYVVLCGGTSRPSGDEPRSGHCRDGGRHGYWSWTVDRCALHYERNCSPRMGIGLHD